MPAVSFSFRFSFEQARKQAKDLHRDLRAGDPQALRRLESHHPEQLAASPSQLADAQLVVAREHGFESWTQLKDFADPQPLYRSEPLTDGQNRYVNGRPWEEQEARLRRVAVEALSHCDIMPREMSIAGHMGNFGYSDFGLRVTTDGDEPSHLVKVRYPYDHFPLVEVHRQVASLCAWLVALDQDTVLDVQVPEPDDDGQMCQLIDHRPDGPAAVCTVQRWLPGTDLVGTDEGVDELPRETFVVLGELLRRVHDHGRRWQRPRGFNRMRTDWLADVAEVEQDYWNSRGDEGLSADEHLLLKHATELLVRHREASHEPWGLTHGDFHAGNCIVHQGRTSPIDFDHCALSYQFDDAGWFLATVENPDMRRAFLEGYTAAKREQKDFIRLMEGALIAGRTRRCAWGGPVPGELIKDCEDYLSGRSFIF